MHTNLMREPRDYVDALYDEIRNAERSHGGGPTEVVVSPRTYNRLQRALETPEDRYRGTTDRSREGLNFLGVRIVSDPHATDDRFYCIWARDYSDRGYVRLRMDRVTSDPRFQELNQRVVDNQAETRSQNSLTAMAEMLRGWSQSSIFRGVHAGQDTLMERVTRDAVNYGQWEGRFRWGEEDVEPPLKKRHKKSKECRNWERRMLTSFERLAKEYK